MWPSYAKVSLLKYRGLATHKHKSNPSGTLLRLNPTNDSEFSSELLNDVVVNVNAEENGFSHVSFNSQQGWIRSEYLTVLPATHYPLRFLNINMSWGNPKGSERSMVLRCQEKGKRHFVELAEYINANVDIATVQEVASWSPLFQSGFLDDFDHHHCAKNHVSCIVRKTVGSWRQIEFSMSNYIKGLRGVCVIHSDAYNCTIASVWFDHDYSGGNKSQFLSHVLSYLPQESRIILGIDANDDTGSLNKDFAYKGKKLYNKSLNMSTCCEDAHYSMPGDYIFDTKESGVSEYMVPFEERFNQCYGDHLGLYYTTVLEL